MGEQSFGVQVADESASRGVNSVSIVQGDKGSVRVVSTEEINIALGGWLYGYEGMEYSQY